MFEELAADPSAGGFHPHPMTRAEAVRIVNRAVAGQDLYFAAFIGDRMAGYGMLRGWDEGYAIPSFGVAVRPAFRGAGLGRRLLRFAIAYARERGTAKVMLKVHLDNPSARHLYESEGFVFEQMSDDPAQVKGLLSL
jgi:ribosomal protein S18 acetylase RimI-like enzyme